MTRATVELSKEEVNIVLESLDLLMATYKSMSVAAPDSERSVTIIIPQLEVASAAWTAVFDAGTTAGWSVDAPAPDPIPDLLPEEDEITGYPV